MFNDKIFSMIDSTSNTQIHIQIGNIIDQECDIIVNAANIYLQKGSGICGAIFNGAGSQLKEACDIQLQTLGRNLSPGESVVTPGFNLKAQYIIHSVTPRCMFRWNDKIEATMRMTYQNIFEMAEHISCKSIAIPAIGIGHHHCEADKCSIIAISELFNYLHRKNSIIQEIRFVLSDEFTQEFYIKSLNSILQMKANNATSRRV